MKGNLTQSRECVHADPKYIKEDKFIDTNSGNIPKFLSYEYNKNLFQLPITETGV